MSFGETPLGLLVLKKVTDLPVIVPRNPHNLHLYFNDNQSETCNENLVWVFLLFSTEKSDVLMVIFFTHR